MVRYPLGLRGAGNECVELSMSVERGQWLRVAAVERWAWRTSDWPGGRYIFPRYRLVRLKSTNPSGTKTQWDRHDPPRPVKGWVSVTAMVLVMKCPRGGQGPNPFAHSSPTVVRLDVGVLLWFNRVLDVSKSRSTGTRRRGILRETRRTRDS